jgi:hypothetical protein
MLPEFWRTFKILIMKKLKTLSGMLVFIAVIYACGSSNEQPAAGVIHNTDTSGSIPGAAEEKNNRDTTNVQVATQTGGGTANPAASETNGSSKGGITADTSAKR